MVLSGHSLVGEREREKKEEGGGSGFGPPPALYVDTCVDAVASVCLPRHLQGIWPLGSLSHLCSDWMLKRASKKFKIQNETCQAKNSNLQACLLFGGNQPAPFVAVATTSKEEGNFWDQERRGGGWRQSVRERCKKCVLYYVLVHVVFSLLLPSSLFQKKECERERERCRGTGRLR